MAIHAKNSILDGMIDQMVKTTAQASAAIDEALAYVEASNRGIASLEAARGSWVAASIEDGYQAMAADKEREVEAMEWCNAIAGDMADQVMAADKTRLKNKVGVLSKKDMLAVEDAIKVHLGMAR
jgi:hypothetical protein